MFVEQKILKGDDALISNKSHHTQLSHLMLADLAMMQLMGVHYVKLIITLF